MSPFIKYLTDWLEAHQVSVPPQSLDGMYAHWRAVRRWNDRINLTAVDDPREAALRHYADALGLLTLPDLPERSRVVDIGSGAGFPGVPLALARPDWHVALVEPRRKRCSFLRQVKSLLALQNVQVCCQRVEEGPPGDRYHLAVSRATFSAPDRFDELLPWLLPGGSICAYRGVDAEVPPGWSRKLYTVGDHQQAIHWSSGFGRSAGCEADLDK